MSDDDPDRRVFALDDSAWSDLQAMLGDLDRELGPVSSGDLAWADKALGLDERD